MHDALVNPHPDHEPCNVYCQDDWHALVLLINRVTAQGARTDAKAVIHSLGAFYGALGWQIVTAKPAEADRARILDEMWERGGGRPHLILPRTTRSQVMPVETDTDLFDPWLLCVVPLP